MLWGAYTSEWDDVWLCLLIVRGGCLLTRLYLYFRADLKPCSLIFNMKKSDFWSDSDSNVWGSAKQNYSESKNNVFRLLLLSKQQSKTHRPFFYHHKLQRKAANLYFKEAGTSKCERFCLKINRTISYNNNSCQLIFFWSTNQYVLDVSLPQHTWICCVVTAFIPAGLLVLLNNKIHKKKKTTVLTEATLTNHSNNSRWMNLL